MSTPAESADHRGTAARAPEAERIESCPPAPESLEDTGLSRAVITALIRKVLFSHGARTGDQLADLVRLPFTIADEQIASLQQRHLVEVRGTSGHGRRGYTFDLTGAGREQAQDLLSAHRYVGPVPVPLELFSTWVRRQSVRQLRIPRARILEGLEHLVLDPDFIDSFGPAVNSGKSILLYGDAGNGKTSIAEAIAKIMGGAIYVPHAIECQGQIIQFYDPTCHHRIEGSADAPPAREWLMPPMRHDPRFVRIRRPVVIVGGELTLDQLELQYDPNAGLYRAPAQLKASGGVFLVDDFGRQRVRPRNLLNRWMIPLDRRTDYLGFSMGQRIEVPFDCLLIFATNLSPTDLVEEAFLRRLHYKIPVGDPTREQYMEIFRRCCEARRIEFDRGTVERLYDSFYTRLGRAPRSCHPRDILEQVSDMAGYFEIEPSLSAGVLEQACKAYFIDFDSDGNGGARSDAHGSPPADRHPGTADVT